MALCIIAEDTFSARAAGASTGVSRRKLTAPRKGVTRIGHTLASSNRNFSVVEVGVSSSGRGAEACTSMHSCRHLRGSFSGA